MTDTNTPEDQGGALLRLASTDKLGLVERLRKPATAPNWATADRWMLEAADEIERLRGELACAAQDCFAAESRPLPTEWLVKVRRLVQGFEHVSGLARLWEPDYSTGSERALWARATEACADVAKLLREAEGPNAELTGETPDVSNEHQGGEPAALQLNDGLGVRQLDAQSPRVESGPTRFGDDWCGVFLRGDTAFYYAMTLRQVLHPNGEDVDPMTGALARIQLRGLLRILEASDERTHA